MLTALQVSVRRSTRLTSQWSRHLASVSSSIDPNSVGPFQVFDRNVKVLQKDRSAIAQNGKKSRTVDYVRNEVAERMIERLMVSSKICAQFTHPLTRVAGYKTQIYFYIRYWLWIRTLFQNAGLGDYDEGRHAGCQR